MELTERLRLWGTTHAQARAAEHAAKQQGRTGGDLPGHARALRERADRLHREIYSSIGDKDPRN